MKNRINVSKLLQKKTTKMFKITFLFFALTLIVIGISCVLVQRDYLQIKKDFITNENTHMITVSGKYDLEDQAERALEFKDRSEIEEITHGKIYSKLSVNWGTYDGDGNVFYLYTVSPFSKNILNIESGKDAICYSKHGSDNKSKITLGIPLPQKDGGGFHSTDMLHLNFKVCESLQKNNPFDLYDEDQLGTGLLISNKAFYRIMEASCKSSWHKIQDKYDDGNPYGFSIIENYYVYVDDLNEVEIIANKLNKKGYELNYVNKAFENLGKSIDQMIIIFMILLAVIVFFAYFAVTLFFNSFYRNQQKDMGILYHMGYSSDRIVNIYSWSINRYFLIIGLIVLIINFIVSIIVIGKAQYIFALGLSAFLLFIILVVKFLSAKMIKKYAREPILTLLKFSKEVE